MLVYQQVLSSGCLFTLATVLIPSPTDLVQTTALRALGARGDVCDIAWPQSKFPVSRYCRKLHSIVSADIDPEAYAEQTLKLCKTVDYDVVLPTSMSSLEALLPHIGELNKLTHTLLPTIQQVEIGMDKRNTIEMCCDLGFAYPDTVFLSEESKLEDIAESVGFPLIVKHQRNFGGSYGVRCVSEMSELRPTIRELVQLGGTISDCMIQRFIPGALFDACAVAHKGKVATMVTQVRRLMYPVSGGVAANLITVDVPGLTAQATRIIAALNWTGPLQLEFKWDAANKEFLLIEINPRFWGTTGAWLRAGLNFPGVAVDLAMGRDVHDSVKLDRDLRFKYLIGRTPYALIQLLRAKGLAELRDPKKFSQTWYDFDIRDPVPDLCRVYKEFRKVLRGDRLLVDNTLPANLIPAYMDIPD